MPWRHLAADFHTLKQLRYIVLIAQSLTCGVWGTCTGVVKAVTVWVPCTLGNIYLSIVKKYIIKKYCWHWKQDDIITPIPAKGCILGLIWCFPFLGIPHSFFRLQSKLDKIFQLSSCNLCKAIISARRNTACRQPEAFFDSCWPELVFFFGTENGRRQLEKQFKR